MINALWLLLIVPASAFVGMVAVVLCMAAKRGDMDEPQPEKQPERHMMLKKNPITRRFEEVEDDGGGNDN